MSIIQNEADSNMSSSTADIVGVMICSMIFAQTLLGASVVGASSMPAEYRLFAFINTAAPPCRAPSAFFFLFRPTVARPVDALVRLFVLNHHLCAWNLFMFFLSMSRDFCWFRSACSWRRPSFYLSLRRRPSRRAARDFY